MHLNIQHILVETNQTQEPLYLRIKNPYYA